MTAINGPVELLPDEFVRRLVPQDEAGLGTLETSGGNLPLTVLDVRASISGLVASVELRQAFRNPHDQPLEATYIFPLPDRAAVTGMRLQAGDRTIEGVLRERGAAREAYDEALRAGQQAAIAEEERPDVFTMRVGNILPGERVSVSLTMVQPLPYEDGAALFRFPLVVGHRYIPGAALPDEPVGDGMAPDTDAVPDASRITPPVLLPGFPNPVRLSIEVDVDPAGLPLLRTESSLHAVRTDGSRISILPGERADRDLVLRLHYGRRGTATTALTLAPDESGDEGTFLLTVLPPAEAPPARARDVVVVLDRSGSMQGWKMVAARRAAARIVDTLTAADRFAVIAFDDRMEHPAGLPEGLVAATDRNRFRAVEHLARIEARGGTEMLRPLTSAVGILGDGNRDRVLVLVTDGQVGNEDQILSGLTSRLRGIRVHAIGIDTAVNAGFLTRLAGVGGGRCELVESEDRLDEAAGAIHRRIAAPLVTDIRFEGNAIDVDRDTVAPARLPDLLWGVPLVLTGRWRSLRPPAEIVVRGRLGADGLEWVARAAAFPATAPALAPTWARAHLRDLEDRYAAARRPDERLERRIVDTSLRFGVLCRFTAFVAIDPRPVTDGAAPIRIIQPVEPPAGWGMFQAAGAPAPCAPPQAMTPTRMMAQPRLARERVAPRFDAVAFADEEVRRLREATGQPEADRRALLADLATRLDALARHLGPGEIEDGVRERLRALAEELAGCTARGADLDRLWERTLTALDELAKPPAPARRPTFWRR